MEAIELARNLYELREAGYLVAADLDAYFLETDEDLAEAARLVASLPAGIPLDEVSLLERASMMAGYDRDSPVFL